MRLLGIDFGTKRLGVAVAMEEGRYLFPRDTLEAATPDGGLAALLALAADEGSEAFILGLPLNADGSEGPMAAAARKFGARLVIEGRRPLHFVDERYSSQEAEEQLRERYPKDTRKRRLLRDRGAAVIILRTFLEHGDIERWGEDEAQAYLAALPPKDATPPA